MPASTGDDKPLEGTTTSLIRDGVRYAKKWNQHHGQETSASRSLAEVLVKLRMLYEDANGKPDIMGRSSAYRDAAGDIYRKAGLDDEAEKKIQNAVRYHASTLVREVLRGQAKNDKQYRELCAYYKLNPLSVNERRGSSGSSSSGTVAKLRGGTLHLDNPGEVFRGVVRFVGAALEVEVTAAGARELDEAAREELRGELDAAAERLDALRAALDAAGDE